MSSSSSSEPSVLPASPQARLLALLSEASGTDMLCDPLLDDPPCPACQALFDRFAALIAPVRDEGHRDSAPILPEKAESGET